MRRAAAFALTFALPLLLAGASADAPELLGPGVVSTAVNEFGGTPDPDGRTLFFAASVHRSYMYAIYESAVGRNGRYGPPRLVPFTGRGRDFDLVFAPGGASAFFVSDRPLPGQTLKAYNVWRISRRAGRWGDPEPLPAPVNRPPTERKTSAAHEWFVSASANGVLYLASADRPGGLGGADLWRVEPDGDGYGAPVNLGPAVNTPGYESEAMVAPDERFIVFSALDRPGGYGDWDLYITWRGKDGRWAPARNLGPRVNTPQRDYSPRLSGDGRHLYFTSERYFGTGRRGGVGYAETRASHGAVLNGYGNLYRIALSDLPEAAPPPIR